MSKRLQIEGRTFGYLKVLKCVGSNKHGKSVFLCECKCKERIECVGSSLVNGLTTSCGCVQKEIAKECGELSSKVNKYDLAGKYGVGWTSNTNKEFYFDLEDYDKIKDFCWYESKHGYIESRIKIDEKYRSISLHRFVLDVNDKTKVDHIKHQTNDCRKEKLRIVNDSQSAMNKGMYKNNTSGHKGVCFDKRTSKWIAYISKNNKRIYLGSFAILDEAIKVRQEAEEKYFGEYSYNNSMQK